MLLEGVKPKEVSEHLLKVLSIGSLEELKTRSKYKIIPFTAMYDQQ